MTPKVFISYSWSSPGHQALIRGWAEQLSGDGIDVVMDIYDLKEGQDKYAFMERMVTDPTVSHVVIFSDKVYAEKADARKAGVGTESQIISKEVYDKVGQSKFIPIACEFSDQGEPYLPIFLKSRIWIDFSSPEAVNQNWERLLRAIYGRPVFEKPALGKPPAYILSDSKIPPSPAISKFNALRQAILQGSTGVSVFRRQFLEACLTYADSLRVRATPQEETFAQKVLDDCTKLKLVRDHIIDWVLLESEALPGDAFNNALLNFLEHLAGLKDRPAELGSWNNSWFEAHALFVYETFLYIIAALLKTQSYSTLHEVFTSQYLLPEPVGGQETFFRYESFHATSRLLEEVLAPGKRLKSAAAELIRKHADRLDLPFKAVMESDLLAFLMALIRPDGWWFPQTLYYALYNYQFPFFLRAAQHKHFKNLVKITGITSAEELKKTALDGYKRLDVIHWYDFNPGRSLWELLNMEKLDSIQ